MLTRREITTASSPGDTSVLLSGKTGPSLVDEGGLQGLPTPAMHQLPKVALMFLTRGEMPLEPIWADFLAAAAAVVRSAGIAAGQLGWEALFALYVHPPPDFPGYTPGSLFAGREVANRTAVQWGQHSVVRGISLLCWRCAPQILLFTRPSVKLLCIGCLAFRPAGAGAAPVAAACPSLLRAHGASVTLGWRESAGLHGHSKDVTLTCLQVTAERALLVAALRDPLNQRFVLLSDSCIPLYHPATIYLQVLGEPRSRVNACSNQSNPDDGRQRMDFR